MQPPSMWSMYTSQVKTLRQQHLNLLVNVPHHFVFDDTSVLLNPADGILQAHGQYSSPDQEGQDQDDYDDGAHHDDDSAFWDAQSSENGSSSDISSCLSSSDHHHLHHHHDDLLSGSNSNSVQTASPPIPMNDWRSASQNGSALSSRAITPSVRSAVDSRASSPSCSLRAEDRPPRLLFLGVPRGFREHTIMSVSPSHRPSEAPAHWQQMCLFSARSTGPSLILASGQGGRLNGCDDQSAPARLSRDEQLSRERKRQNALGITSFEFHSHSGRVLFPKDSSINYCESRNNSQAVFYELQSQHPSVRLDCKFSSNPNLISFVRDGDVWIALLETGKEHRVTFARQDAADDIASHTKSAGLAEFIMQEEFSRFTGYWWQPQPDAAPTTTPVVHRILFMEVDEAPVDLIHIGNSAQHADEVLRYPRTGQANAVSEVKIVEFTISNGRLVGELVTRSLPCALSRLFPWLEYVVRCSWTPDGEWIQLQLLDRAQQYLVLVVLPLSAFATPSFSMHGSVTLADLGGFVVCEESSSHWVNILDCCIWTKSPSSPEPSLIWCSERTGFAHLDFITCTRNASGIVTNSTRVPLTQGPWIVEPGRVWCDAVRGLVYFLGTRDTPLELHLYALDVPLLRDVYCPASRSSLPVFQPVRLTALGYSHAITMNSTCQWYTDTFSSISAPHCTVLVHLRVAEASELASGAVLEGAPTCKSGVAAVMQLACLLLSNRASGALASLQAPTLAAHVHATLFVSTAYPHFSAPELFQVAHHDGFAIHGLLFKPRAERGVASTPCPTVLYVYGGPSLQMVTNEYQASTQLRLHVLAAMGYAVVMVDGRGSARRGVEFETHLHGRLGQVEMADQIMALQHVALQSGLIDLDRVAVYGWSYGGYLALMGLAQHADFFRAAIAGAPVSCWRSYDAAYTERYLGLFDESSSSIYSHASVMNYIDGFPDEEDRLLILHGLIDENVHFSNTAALVDALVFAGKPYRLQVYPNERHGIRHLSSSDHLETLLLTFLGKVLARR
ncbi:DPP9 protein [Capsaspora owczarzaki ATCC 30864]|nr:DPP9 protein [Capsaspora owczarzaki ATCC 30864]|eukprot:XP_004364300.2 DPP9 protein [Capsaspora owczarzaki ATCC 30864]